jgi:hypothetical protein
MWRFNTSGWLWAGAGGSVRTGCVVWLGGRPRRVRSEIYRIFHLFPCVFNPFIGFALKSPSQTTSGHHVISHLIFLFQRCKECSVFRNRLTFCRYFADDVLCRVEAKGQLPDAYSARKQRHYLGHLVAAEGTERRSP